MNKEQTIKKVQDFEAEVSALALKYRLTTYSMIGFIESDPVSAYPVCLHWVRDDIPVSGKHPQIIKLLFMGGFEAVKSMTGQGVFHEEYHGKFKHKKPNDDK